MKVVDFSDQTLTEDGFSGKVTVSHELLSQLKKWLQMDGLTWIDENILGDYVEITFDNIEAYNQAKDWVSEETEKDEFKNGDIVKLTSKYADRGDETFTVSQVGNKPGKAWIGDENDRGWYVRFNQIEKVEDDDDKPLEDLDWNNLGEGLSVEDKLRIFEEYYTKGNIIESNDENSREYFMSLFNMSDDPIENQTYIVVPLVLIDNRVTSLNPPSYMKFLGNGITGLIFYSSGGEIIFPAPQLRGVSTTGTFTFSNIESYNKLRNIIKLKYNFHLPEINVNEHAFTVSPTGERKTQIDKFDDDRIKNVLRQMKKSGSSRDEREHQLKQHKFFKSVATEGREFTWDSLGNEMSMKDRMSIFEEYCIKGNLTESNKESSVDYFRSLSNMSDKPIKGETYIVVPMILVNNIVRTIAKPNYLKLVGIKKDEYIFDSSDGRKMYPSPGVGNNAIYTVLIFSTVEKYDKLRNIIRLKFDLDLPAIENNTNEGDVVPVDFGAKKSSGQSGDSDVIQTKFATKQAQKGKDKYQRQPDVADSIPLYDPQRKTGVLPHLAKGHEVPFDHFYALGVSDKVSKIIGVTSDGKQIVTSTMGAPVELASKIADAYNRKGFSDVPIEKVPMKGYNETELDEAKHFRTAYGWAGGRNEKTGGMHKHPEARRGRLAMPLKGHPYHTLPHNKLQFIIKDAGEAALAMQGHSPDAEAKYLDQVNDASTVLGYRQKGGQQIVPTNPAVTEGDKVDSITVDVPLFIRMLEFAREDAKTDMDLHSLAARSIKLTKKFGKLSMRHYNKLMKKIAAFNPARGRGKLTTVAGTGDVPDVGIGEEHVTEASSGINLTQLAKHLRNFPGLKMDSIERTSGSDKAWLHFDSKFLLLDLVKHLKRMDPTAAEQNIDIGFGKQTIIQGRNWQVEFQGAEEGWERSQVGVFAEVYKKGKYGDMARAGIDEPETY